MYHHATFTRQTHAQTPLPACPPSMCGTRACTRRAPAVGWVRTSHGSTRKSREVDHIMAWLGSGTRAQSSQKAGERSACTSSVCTNKSKASSLPHPLRMAASTSALSLGLKAHASRQRNERSGSSSSCETRADLRFGPYLGDACPLLQLDD